jgi:hypothetical protein
MRRAPWRAPDTNVCMVGRSAMCGCQVLYTLTIVTSIFVPLQFLTGYDTRP